MLYARAYYHNKAQTRAHIYESHTISMVPPRTHRRSTMIRAFRVGRRLPPPARLGTLARKWAGRRVGGLRPGACGAPSLLHTRCASSRPPLAPTVRRLCGQSVVVRRVATGAAAVWRCRRVKRPKEKEYGSECDASCVLIHVDICFLLVHVELGQCHVQGRYPG